MEGYLAEINQLSKGARVQQIRVMTAKEQLAFYGEDFTPQPCLVIELDNGMLLPVQRDEEGNGPGWLGYAPVTLFQAFNR